ncbi:50S ribosomal protein L13 [Candidatus Woesearchaeota archaeon]|nr:50S ribosomal protein L13 [Candidatus Woesearchaeota archaeon]
MIIDGNNLILGRLGSFAAKKALQGEKIDIVNCENIVITGKKKYIFEKYRKRLKRGIHSKGPFTYRMPDRFVKRALRGMLPYKKEKGKKAFEKIKCYMGVPENEKFNKEKMETIKSADISKVPSLDYLRVKDVCKEIGAKI